MKPIVVCLITGLSLLVCSCDSDPAAVGLSVDADTGALIVYATLCADHESVVGVALKDASSGAVLWKIASPTGTKALVFPTDQPPPGFTVIQAYPAKPPTGLLSAEITIRDGAKVFTVRDTYRVSDLKPGLVAADSEYVPLQDWEHYVTGDFCSANGGLLS